MLSVIDVFSRYAWVEPLKNKNTTTITEVMNKIIGDMKPKPEIINCDNGSEFISSSFQKMCDKSKITINYVQKGDHHKLGVIDRFIRTLRGIIEKYLTMNKTNKYIDKLDKIVYNYNHSYHSTIKSSPVKFNSEIIREDFNNREMEALMNEETFEINDLVRHAINKAMFEKGSRPKWSANIYKIKEVVSPHSYLLNDNTKKTYKYYELQRVTDNEKSEILKNQKLSVRCPKGQQESK